MSSQLDLEAVMTANQTIPGTTPAPTVESTEWTEIRGIIEDHITNQPRSLQKEIGPSELGTDCLHCLAARLAGWEKRQSPRRRVFRLRSVSRPTVLPHRRPGR